MEQEREAARLAPTARKQRDEHCCSAQCLFGFSLRPLPTCGAAVFRVGLLALLPDVESLS